MASSGNNTPLIIAACAGLDLDRNCYAKTRLKRRLETGRRPQLAAMLLISVTPRA